MGFAESIKTCLQKYIDFNGRASRSEYWWFMLVTVVLSFIPVIVWILRLVLLLPSRSEYWWFMPVTVVLAFIPVIGWILGLMLLLPSLAVQVRRLHDLNRSAGWLLLLVPPIAFIGVWILLIMSIFPGTRGPNRYGPDSLQPSPGTSGNDYQYPGYHNTSPSGNYGLPDYSGNPPETPDDRRFCTQCGLQLQADARFCTNCGTEL